MYKGFVTFEPPDVRDGLTRIERVVLVCLAAIERERPGRGVPIVQLYGRVREHLDVSIDEVHAVVQRLGARRSANH